ncbi:PREDICTED: uncharacterized protein LOC108562070 [Nicrophorus vespilloides]|uniref:Uncharacterized protein LOC108562070 n=1 Tax=Nicrophorus vespilloides TaxID=110193 RepID=A0ABM1MMG4_NICVS|nr:PREDICTED: uncharacterized protein LOC108562070 [Nicrophorus vespilloides]
MNKFLVFASVLVCASADIGLKLREGSPTGSYLPGVQSGSNSYGAYSNGPQQHYAPGGYAGSYGVGPQGYGGQVSYNTFGGAPQYSVQQNFAGIPQAVQHHRSFFFDAPEDLGETHVRVHVQPSAAAGDKTIYIRAQPTTQRSSHTSTSLNKEQQDIVVPAAVQGPAAKPEVVFVKYSNQKEAEQKIQDIQEGASSGDSAKTVFNHRELVSSIKDEPAHQHQHGISFGGPGAFIGGSAGPSHSSGESVGNVSGGEPHYGPAGESGPY